MYKVVQIAVANTRNGVYNSQMKALSKRRGLFAMRYGKFGRTVLPKFGNKMIFQRRIFSQRDFGRNEMGTFCRFVFVK